MAVTTPLWASYLVKAYAWRVLLSPEGPLAWAAGGTPGYGLTATVITLSYLWLPYMVIPVFAAFERVPDTLLDASADLGASDATTLRTVMAPLVFPGIAAGSIFTFSLSLGDYIAVTIVGGKTQMLGNLIYGQLVTANNQPPLAAALSLIPLVAIVAYLLAMRRTGAWRTSDAIGADPVGATVLDRLVLLFLYAPCFWSSSTRSMRRAASPSRRPGSRCAGGSTPRVASGCGKPWPTPRWSASPPPRSPGAGHHGGVRRAAVPVLRQAGGEFPCRATDHTARYRHRHRAQRDLHLGTRRHTRHRDGDHRARHVLHRDRLQQRPGPVTALGTHFEDASADLGGASPWQTFRYVTLPMMRGALVAGAILAFALSFDEIVVTTFTAGPAVQTLPIWIFANLFRPNQRR